MPPALTACLCDEAPQPVRASIQQDPDVLWPRVRGQGDPILDRLLWAPKQLTSSPKAPGENGYIESFNAVMVPAIVRLPYIVPCGALRKGRYFSSHYPRRRSQQRGQFSIRLKLINRMLQPSNGNATVTQVSPLFNVIHWVRGVPRRSLRLIYFWLIHVASRNCRCLDAKEFAALYLYFRGRAGRLRDQ